MMRNATRINGDNDSQNNFFCVLDFQEQRTSKGNSQKHLFCLEFQGTKGSLSHTKDILKLIDQDPKYRQRF